MIFIFYSLFNFGFSKIITIFISIKTLLDMNRSLLADVGSHLGAARLVIPILIPLIVREVRRRLHTIFFSRIIGLLGCPIDIVRLGTVRPYPILTNLVHSDPCEILRVALLDSTRGQI